MASKLTKKINSRFNPTLLSGYPVYAAGGYLQLAQQAQGQTAQLGSMMGDFLRNQNPNSRASAILAGGIEGGVSGGGLLGSVMGAFKANQDFKAQQDLQKQQREEFLKKDMISNLPAQHYYTPTFAMGGKMYPDGGEVDAISGAAPKYWQIPITEREDFKGNWLSYQDGGELTDKEYFEKYGKLPSSSSDSSPINLLRKFISKKIYPFESEYGYLGYSSIPKKDILKNVIKGLISTGEKKDLNSLLGTEAQDILNLYLNQPVQDRKNTNLTVSNYRPTKAKEDKTYLTFKDRDKLFRPDNIKTLIKSGETHGYDHNLGQYKIDRGSDEKGKYISIYDKWDLHPLGNDKKSPINWLENIGLSEDQSQGIGKPVEFYDRQYYEQYSPNMDYPKLVEPRHAGNYIPNEEKIIPDFTKKLFKSGGTLTPSKAEIPLKKYGGKISRSEIAKGIKEEMEHTSSKKVSRKTAMDHLKEDPKYYTKLKKAGLADSYAFGGLYNSYANGGNLDNTTVFQGGGSHQENQLGGIPQGTNALVEEGEVRFKDYIFSNRIPYTKKK